MGQNSKPDITDQNAETIEDILALYDLPEKSIDVVIKTSLYDQIKTKLDEIKAVKLQGNKKGLTGGGVRALEEQLAQLYEEAERHTRTFTFKGLPRKDYKRLLEAHPPTAKQIDDWKKELGQRAPFNEDTFPAALIAATCVSPKMTVDQAQQICDYWSESQVEEIFGTAFAVCRDPIEIPFYKRGSETTQNTG